MIPGTFDYHRPASLHEAVRLLADLGEEARPLAGGHSLIPMMKLRLASPEHLVDLRTIPELRQIRQEDGRIVIGATATQQEIIASPLLQERLPILAEAAHLIADPQVRAMGTLGGNVANGDPGNDMPALMQCLGARYRLLGAGGERAIAARDFYQGAYVTALEPGEILTGVEIDPPPAGHGWAYEKLKRKVGDYATAAAAVVLTRSGDRVATCSIALTNLAETPLWAEEAAAAVTGTALDPDALKAARRAAEAIMSPASDGRGPAEYRVSVGGVMTVRALQRAYARAATQA